MGYFSLWIPQVLSVNLDSPAVLPASVLIQHFFSVLLWTSVDNDYISDCYNTMLDYHIIDKNFSGPVMKLLVAPFFFFFFGPCTFLMWWDWAIKEHSSDQGQTWVGKHALSFCAHRCVLGFSFPHLCKGIMMCKEPEKKSTHVHRFLPGETGFEATTWICLCCQSGY